MVGILNDQIQTKQTDSEAVNPKLDWIYMMSDTLKMKIALQIENWRVYCEDKTQYTKKEIDIMANKGQEIDLFTHTVKRVFHGEIVE